MRESRPPSDDRTSYRPPATAGGTDLSYKQAYDRGTRLAHVSRAMRPLKLHTKTTLLASAITLAVLGVLVALVSVRFAERVREEQKLLAQIEADNLADHISRMPAPRDPEQVARLTALVHGS